MNLLLLFVVLSTLCLLPGSAQAQKNLEQQASWRAEQRVVLNLQQATSIRLLGSMGKQVRVRAAVTINDG